MYQYGDIIESPFRSFKYQVVGPVCRLYDRTELEYPHCSIRFRSKMPAWNRIGKRFVPDIGCKRHQSYSVILLDNQCGNPQMEITLYWLGELDQGAKEWWVTPSCKMKHYQLAA